MCFFPQLLAVRMCAICLRTNVLGLSVVMWWSHIRGPYEEIKVQKIGIWKERKNTVSPPKKEVMGWLLPRFSEDYEWTGSLCL